MNVNIQGLKRLLGFRSHLDPVNKRQSKKSTNRLAPKKHVGTDIQIIGECQVLINRFDTVRASLVRVIELDLLPFVSQDTAVRRVNSGDYFDQRRFPGAVVSCERQDLAGKERQGNLFQRMDAAKSF